MSFKRDLDAAVQKNDIFKSIIREALPELKARLRQLEACQPCEKTYADVSKLTRLIMKAENTLLEP
jgi:hypothetical protein